jgi:hypothetical protein
VGLVHRWHVECDLDNEDMSVLTTVFRMGGLKNLRCLDLTGLAFASLSRRQFHLAARVHHALPDPQRPRTARRRLPAGEGRRELQELLAAAAHRQWGRGEAIM